MITATDLTKYYDPMIVLDQLTFTVRPGEIYCLLGPNGSGKSTTIDLLFGFIKPVRGSATVCGFDTVTHSAEVRKHTALVSDRTALYDGLSAVEHIALFAALSGRKDLNRLDYLRLLRSVSLPEGSFDQKVGKFSKGMKHKLTMAIAILKDAPVLLVDEPAGGLDPVSTYEQGYLLAKMRKGGKTILMATHDALRAHQLADTVGVLRDGVLILQLKRPEFLHEGLKTIYLRHLAMNCRP